MISIEKLMLKTAILTVSTCICLILASSVCAFTETQAVKAIMGEARNQGYQGMLAVACGIRNRGTLQGVYGLNAKINEPKWVWDMADKAWRESLTNRIHSGDHWENIKSFGTPEWVKGMKLVYQYKDHVFYKSNKKAR